MLSRDSRLRRVIEHGLHALAALALIAAVWIAFRLLSERPVAMASGAEVPKAVERWSTSESPERAHVVFDRVPSPQVRDWVDAIDRTDTTITWEGVSLVPSGLVVEPIPDPTRPLRIWVAAPPGSEVLIRDSLGAIASVRASDDGGIAVTVPRVEGKVTASVGNSAASALVREVLELKPVLILGTAGWEAKFVTAALEEHGWKCDARLRISPKEVVVQGPAAPKIDVEHYSVVIALDRTAAQYARTIGQYVAAGGGLIAIGDAAGLPQFALILAGRAAEPSEEGEFSESPAGEGKAPRHALALAALSNIKADAVALEYGPDRAVAAAARRVGDGRVLQVGYRDTWRWRMAGTDADPVSAHRKWWAAMASSVAHAERKARAPSEVVEPTPLASLIAALGPPSVPEAPGALAPFLNARAFKWLFAIALAALLVEWASRRLRGAA